MAVIEYKAGQHPLGLVGFRVACTLGSDKRRRERFISIKSRGYDKAKQKAEQLNREFQQEAEEYKRQQRHKSRSKRAIENKAIIVDGLRANIHVAIDKRCAKPTTRFTPCFLVTTPKRGTADTIIRISKHGYQNAYIKAVMLFCERYDVPEENALSLMAKIPNRDIFTGFLLKRVKSNGHKLTRKQLLAMLD